MRLLQPAGTERRDETGARRGHVSQPLLDQLLDDPFLARKPPRSTGRERYGAGYSLALAERGRALGVSDDDLMATAVELVAAAVADSVARFLAPKGGPKGSVDAVYASGGGVRNPSLMAALGRRLAPARVASAEALGVPPDAKEALAFAFLAHQTLCGGAGNVPAATGAAHPVPLGHITPGRLG